MKYTAKFPNATIERNFWKDFGLLSKEVQEETLNAIKSLENLPRPFGRKPFKQLNPPIMVYNYTAQYRIRVRDYRILYDINDKQKTVWIYVIPKTK